MMNDNATLQLPVLVEALTDRPGYVARLGEPFNLAEEAGSPEDALRRLSQAVQKRLQTGACILPLVLPLKSPSPACAGWLPDDDLTREWQEAVEQYRRECDAADRDLKIAAIAIEKGGVVVTRNTHDLARIPGLIWEDWSV